VGDLLDKWTAGKYRSAVHRVVNISTTDRYSVPFFYQGNLETKLDPLDRSRGGTGEASETVEQHIKGMFRKSFG
jgi:isopenicillin N synthase-like dioxygenase